MSENKKSSLGKKLFTVITFALTAGILIYFLFSTNGIAELGATMKTLKIRWLLLALICTVVGWFIEGIVLHIFCRHFDHAWSYHNSFTIGMVGVLYNAITPFSTGEPIQVIAMRDMDMDTGMATSIIAVKSLTYQIITVFYALVMMVMKLHYFQQNVSNFSFLTVIGLLANGASIAIVMLFMVSEKLTDKILRAVLHVLSKYKMCKHPDERYERIHAHLQIFHDASKIMGNTWKLNLTAAAFITLQITLSSFIPYFIYRSFNLRGAHISTMIAAQVFVSMVSAFVPLPGSSGAAELSFSAFFGPYFSQKTMIPAIILWRIITCYINIAFSGIYVYISNLKKRRGADA